MQYMCMDQVQQHASEGTHVCFAQGEHLSPLRAEFKHDNLQQTGVKDRIRLVKELEMYVQLLAWGCTALISFSTSWQDAVLTWAVPST